MGRRGDPFPLSRDHPAHPTHRPAKSRKTLSDSSAPPACASNARARFLVTSATPPTTMPIPPSTTPSIPSVLAVFAASCADVAAAVAAVTASCARVDSWSIFVASSSFRRRDRGERHAGQVGHRGERRRPRRHRHVELRSVELAGEVEGVLACLRRDEPRAVIAGIAVAPYL